MIASSGIISCRRSGGSQLPHSELISSENIVDHDRLLRDEQTETTNESLLPSYFKFTYLEISSLPSKLFSPDSWHLQADSFSLQVWTLDAERCVIFAMLLSYSPVGDSTLQPHCKDFLCVSTPPRCQHGDLKYQV
jgi:hypothetical protein